MSNNNGKTPPPPPPPPQAPRSRLINDDQSIKKKVRLKQTSRTR